MFDHGECVHFYSICLPSPSTIHSTFENLYFSNQYWLLYIENNYCEAFKISFYPGWASEKNAKEYMTELSFLFVSLFDSRGIRRLWCVRCCSPVHRRPKSRTKLSHKGFEWIYREGKKKMRKESERKRACERIRAMERWDFTNETVYPLFANVLQHVHWTMWNGDKACGWGGSRRVGKWAEEGERSRSSLILFDRLRWQIDAQIEQTPISFPLSVPRLALAG